MSLTAEPKKKEKKIEKDLTKQELYIPNQSNQVYQLGLPQEMHSY